ncbi:MAG: class I SAM-dependent methyltransferase [Candidatus Bathyarchaeota archaeon]|nr:class I SAM-dependent methyltransferase [Candidatus Bathyarchaeota archaeon]
MVCHGGFNLDETTRRSWYDPEAILEAIGLREGMTFVDVGCAHGFFTFLAAKIVGETGRVYGVDVDPAAIEKLMQKAKEEGLSNITAKAASAEETVFCKECADFVFFSMSLHDFHDPAKVLVNARAMIKPEGKLVDLDWKKQDKPVGPPSSILFSEEKVTELFEAAGFTVESIAIGKYHYIITGKPLT